MARAVASLREGGGSVDGLVFDVAQPEQVQAALAELDAKASRVDILGNNVGIRDRRSVFDFTPDDVRRMLEVNFARTLRFVPLGGSAHDRRRHRRTD